MTALALPRVARGPAGRLLDALIGRDRPLALAGLALLALVPAFALGLALDPRTLHDAPIWLKPLKFALSLGVYLLTLAWFMGDLPDAVRRGRSAAAIRAIALGAAGFEMAYIALQAARGLGSHYNVGDPFHAAMYGLMGVGAVALTAMSPWLGALVARYRPAHLAPALLWSIVLGLVLTFVLGAGSGAVLSAGDGHWIGGARSDANALPLLGWSRTGGDLRAAHFLGMHAMHVLPAVGLLAARRLPARAGVMTVLAAAAGYSALTGLVFWGAILGLPLVGL
ncbi:MAG TPA: hypothetical protein VEA41_19805 [Salinarimonas sp.]|nr:hypothetical protein [Salinarimonas sp.]